MKRSPGIFVLTSFFLMSLPLFLFAQETPTKASPPFYIASKFSIKYHKPTCRRTLKIREQNRITLNSAKEAVDAGYMPCPRCKPPARD